MAIIKIKGTTSSSPSSNINEREIQYLEGVNKIVVKGIDGIVRYFPSEIALFQDYDKSITLSSDLDLSTEVFTGIQYGIEYKCFYVQTNTGQTLNIYFPDLSYQYPNFDNLRVYNERRFTFRNLGDGTVILHTKTGQYINQTGTTTTTLNVSTHQYAEFKGNYNSLTWYRIS